MGLLARAGARCLGAQGGARLVGRGLNPMGCVAITPTMDESRKKALQKHHPELRTGITVIHLLTSLHVDVGGFLTDVESDSINQNRGNVEQVDELIDVLVTKENKDFDYFCLVLEKEGCQAWSNRLKEAAGLGKQQHLSC